MSTGAGGHPPQTNRPGRPRARRGNRVFLVFLVLLSLVTLCLGAWQWQESRQRLAQQSKAAPPESRELAPDFTLLSTDGAAVTLSDLQGKVVLLNFWATWCPPCTAEMPDLNQLYREYGDEKEFVIVGVNLEERPTEVAEFGEQKRIEFPLLLDRDGNVARHNYKVRTLPASLIIDREGNIRDRWSGSISREAMLARIEKVW